MSEQAVIRGSAEILVNGMSRGVVLEVRSLADVPRALQYGQSLDDLAPVDAPRDGVDAEWTATTADGFPAEVLWREDRDVVPEMPAPDEDTEG